jgi:uncharacterized coiled-coil DUF342 family protein
MDADLQKKIEDILKDGKGARQERDTIKKEYNKLLQELITTRNERDDALNEIKELKISLQKAVDVAQSLMTVLKNVRDQRGKGKK